MKPMSFEVGFPKMVFMILFMKTGWLSSNNGRGERNNKSYSS